MDWRTFLYRFMLFIITVVGGGFLFAVTTNILIKLGLMADGFDARQLAMQTTYIYMAATLAGFVSIFINQNWRKVLLLAPLYAPSLFAIIYTIMH